MDTFELEEEDEWGWFITLDLDSKTPKTPKTPIYDNNKKTYPPKINNCDFFKNLLIYGLFYSCLYIDNLYKCINPYSCYKQKITN
jgi:hypothetical protein